MINIWLFNSLFSLPCFHIMIGFLILVFRTILYNLSILFTVGVSGIGISGAGFHSFCCIIRPLLVFILITAIFGCIGLYSTNLKLVGISLNFFVHRELRLSHSQLYDCDAHFPKIPSCSSHQICNLNRQHSFQDWIQYLIVIYE